MLGWMAGPGDRDGDGLLDYAARAPHGLRNQGWKDSADGRARRARRAAGAADHARRAAGLRAARQARPRAPVRARRRRGDRAAGCAPRRPRCASRLERFWLPDAGYYSMGFGADGRPSGALASNQGHLLWGRAVVAGSARAAIRDAVMSPAHVLRLGDPHAGGGRGGLQPGRLPPRHRVAARHGDDRRAGCATYGFDADFDRVFEALLEAASTADAYRLPELFAGLLAHGARDAGPLSRRLPAAGLGRRRHPVPPHVRARPRAGRGWSGGCASAARRCRAWLGRVEVRGLRIAGARVDLRFERAGAGGHVALTDASIERRRRGGARRDGRRGLDAARVAVRATPGRRWRSGARTRAGQARSGARRRS